MKFLKNIMNTGNNFCINFTKIFKCAGLIFTFVALTNFSYSKAMKGNFDLHKACMNNDLKKAQELVNTEKCDVNNFLAGSDYGIEGITPIILGIKHINIVKFLLEKGANVNPNIDYPHGRGGKMLKPLHQACAEGNVEIVQLLLDYNANVSGIVSSYMRDYDEFGQFGGHYNNVTPLHIACAFGNIEIIKLLLKHGANVNTNQSETTPLCFACEYGHKDVVELLLKEGAQVNVFDNDNKTWPLYLACIEKRNKNNYEIVKLLIDNGANVNQFVYHIHTQLPINLACKNNNIAIVQLLLENGADFFDSFYKKTPFSVTKSIEIRILLSLVFQFLQIIKTQNKSSKDVFIKKITSKQSNQRLAIKEFFEKVENSAIKLKKVKPDQNEELRKKTEKYFDSYVFCQLEELDLEKQENDLHDLHEALKNDDFKKIKELLSSQDKKHLINASIKNDIYKGWTPLHFACWKSNKEIVELLLNNNAEVNEPISTGFFESLRPLHLACIKGNKEIVQLLLYKKANRYYLTGENQYCCRCRPIYLANKYKHEEIEQLLDEKNL